MHRWQTSQQAILAILAVLFGLSSNSVAELRPNVLCIVVDDLRPELGCYGNPHIHSPNIDAFAARGRLFLRAYCQQAVCNPSRTSLMTGMRPDSIGVTGNHSHFRTNHPNVVTLPQQFKNHGYHAAAIGKIYHGVFPDGASNTKWDTMGDPESWSVPAIRFGPRYYYTEEGIAAAKLIYQKIYKPTHPGPDDWTKKLVFGPATESPDVPDSTLYDGQVADAAVKTLRELKSHDKPFFLAVGFIKPHSPYVAPKKYFELYKNVALPSHTAFPANAPSFAGHGSGELRRYTDQPKSGVISDHNQRRVRQAYFACISYIDAQIGRVLNELDRSGLSENTIVVLFGDHGYHLGEQGLWGKTTNYELDARVPLIVRAPGIKGGAAGKPSSSLVELVDLYPTLADLAGLPIMNQLEGKSFAPILVDPGHVTKTVALSQYPRGGSLMGYSMRTPTHRLTQWVHRPTGEIRSTELYDYSDGLIETRNVAGDSSELVKKLSPQLETAFAGSFVSSPKPREVSKEPHEANEERSTSFENTKAGPFDQCKTAIGVWRSNAGKSIIDDKHAKTGKHCLQLTGGKESTVTLDMAEAVKTASELTFWAERWTSRAPFSFRIAADRGTGWQEIYDGDKKIRVGRAFLNHVKVGLPVGIKRLQFSCSSPPNTGILIDDLRIAPTRPQEIKGVTVMPLSLPALVGNEASALLKLKIETTGQRNPISLTGLHATLAGDAKHSDLLSFQLRHGTGQSRFLPSRLVASLDVEQAESKPLVFSCPADACQLAEGINYVWISCRLNKKANIDHRVGVTCQEITFSNGQTIKPGPASSIQRMGVAVRNGGDDGAHTYRIPGLATTNKGTLIGVYDARWRGGGDLPGDIDVGMSRSTDGGRTWEPMKVIMDMGNDPRWRYDGIGDPAVLVDQGTGTIWVAATWGHGNRSWVGSGPGLKPAETGQLMLVRSDDDGITWSKPINITSQVKKPEWCFILQGPGKGITMRDGTIVFAAQYQDPPEKKRLPHSTIIYSKDHGKKWQIGTGAFDDTTESQVVEIEPGVLMLNCRYNRKAVRVVMTTRDMGKTWQKHTTSEKSLIEPGACMASLIDVDQEVGKEVGDWLLFSNPDSTRGRHHITIKASPDRGLTWPKENRLLLDEENSAGYSCMTMIDEKTVGILYEGSQAHMTFQRIPLSDLVGTGRKQASTGSDLMGDAAKPLDVFVLTGQSNSLGTIDPRDGAAPAPPACALDAGIPFFWSNRSTRAGDGPAVLIGDSGGKFLSLRPQQGEGKNPVFWGPEVGFARTLRSAGRRDFAIIKASRGGGGNRFWLKGSRDDHMYRHIVSTVSNAARVLPPGRAFRIRAVLYLQGESDSETEAAASGERMEALLTNLRRDLPGASGARLIVGGIATAGTRRDIVRREQAAAADRNPSIEYIDNRDLQRQLYDRLHFGGQAKLEVGQRIAQRWLDIDPTPVSQLSLPRVFSDHMVLQAAASLPIWGKARPDSTVSVQLGNDTLTTTADSNGDWAVRFAPRPSSVAAVSLSVQSGDEQLKLIDVLIGEVWVCAGQSNMEWMLAQAAGAREELASAGNPNLRLLHLTGGARGGSGSYTLQHLARLTPGMFCEGQWETASGASARSFSAVAWYFGRQLQRELKVPVGLICPAVGGTPAEAWIPREVLEADPDFRGMVAGNWLDNERLGAFCRTRGQQNLVAAIQAGLAIPGDPFGPNHSFKPGFMWEAGIEPLIPYAIRGAIWYQGESNAETPTRVREHGRLFPLLINGWRHRWGQGDFPFLYVQLPALNRPEWPWFRDGQRRTLSHLKNVGMAVTIDTGHPSNVHPREKKPAGERLAKWALGTTYALKKHATYSGPLLDVAEREGDALVVSFKHVGKGLSASDGKPIRHFEACGQDGIFHPASATIIGRHTISVSSPKVAEPRHARYAWSPYPDPPVNLINDAGLPASPFSTESEETLFTRRQAGDPHASNTDTRPNILLIVGEDHGCELSCYGDPVIKTPNIDRLASQGVLFENGYVTQSVCSPSRSTIFTGLYPHQNGQLGLATHNYGWFRKWPTTYSLLKKAGYRTGLIGKTHVIPAEAVEDFVDFRSQKSSNFAKRKVADYAVKAGEFFRAGDEPFFMTVNYPDAHWPLQGQVDGLPGAQVDSERVKVMPYVGGETPRLLEVARNYYDCMLRLDACVGQLLKQLDDSGKAEHTLVIFIGDHGAQMARGKVTVYEGGMHVPYIVRWPSVTKAGHRSKALVSTIDLLPTFMDAAGAATPKGLPGKSIRPVLNGNEDKTFREYLVCERNCDAARHTFPQRTIRDARYKLIHSPVRDREDPAARYYRAHGAAHWSGCLSDKELALASEQTKAGYSRWLNPPEVQLFDLRSDPHEWISLADDPKHSATKRRLLSALKQWQKDTRDPLADPDKLRMLLEENDAVFKAKRRSPKDGWRYLDYLFPDNSRPTLN